MILLIDNYDSFSYNLVQLVGTIAPDIRVIRNDEMTVEQIEQLAPTHIIVSPGPGRPSKAGVCEEVIKYFNGKVPILGVCLGHQAICEVYGATITYAKKLMHGKMSVAALDTECPVFAGIGETAEVARYHSLIVRGNSLPEEYQVDAVSEDGAVMGISHKTLPLYGVQFHPEAVLTEYGHELLENFCKIAERFQEEKEELTEKTA